MSILCLRVHLLACKIYTIKNDYQINAAREKTLSTDTAVYFKLVIIFNKICLDVKATQEVGFWSVGYWLYWVS